MSKHVVFVSIPGLRSSDVDKIPSLLKLREQGGLATLTPSFPCVTCPVQANLTTGVGPEQHGVVANGFFYREKGEFEMWTAWNEAIKAPQIWDVLHQHDSSITSAVWFPMLSKGAGADYICTPAPIHNPDGSESLWCYTKPDLLYGELRDTFGHFPLMNFWGPLAGIQSSKWIAESAVHAAERFQPKFSYIYLTHLDYAAQKYGPDSPQAIQALSELDQVLSVMIAQYHGVLQDEITWLVAGEYAITEVNSVGYPNRVLREAGYLQIDETDDGEILNVGDSKAWAMVDHQFAHVFVKDAADIEAVRTLLSSQETVERTFVADERTEIGLNHERSGEIILQANPDAWFAYYYWLDDSRAPGFASTVDIHRKPGYDPVEMFIEMPSKKTPLDATLVKGSHGYPATSDLQKTVLITSSPDLLSQNEYRDTDVASLVYEEFGLAI